MTPAETAIKREIEKQGPITFRRFMELALYIAPGAYYASRQPPIGAAGDYFTSPEVHPAFGALLARQVEQVWLAMGRPGRFATVEVGAGSGALARDLLSYAASHAPSFHRAIQYTLVERNGNSIQERGAALSARAYCPERIRWLPDDESALPDNSVEGCILSNELLDAFSVHRVAVRGGVLMEVYVEEASGRLVETLGDPSTPRIAAYFRDLGILPPEGCIVEVNLAAIDWMRRAASALKRGIVLTLDYGYDAAEMYASRHREGTLLCFCRHTLNNDPYARIGLQDMTTHVDFTTLVREGEAAGLATLGLTTQRSFLSALGLGRYLQILPRMGLRRSDYEANRLGMMELARPEGLGRIKLLVQQRELDGLEAVGLGHDALEGHALGRSLDEESAPLLAPGQMHLNAISQEMSTAALGQLWSELSDD